MLELVLDLLGRQSPSTPARTASASPAMAEETPNGEGARPGSNLDPFVMKR